VEDLEERWLPTSPVITWPAPGDITYGTLLGAAQLDAVADVPGTFIYNPPAGTRLHGGQAQILSAVFTPNDTVDYTSAVATVHINVNTAPLTVTGVGSFNKAYDGTMAASLDMTKAALAGVMAGDSVTVTNTPSATLTGVYGPQALAFDTGGNLYVANSRSDTNTVSKFAPGSLDPGTTLTGLNAPLALAFDPAGNLFVANYTGNTVSKFAPGSTTPTVTLTGLSSPTALAVDRSGKLYVANLGNNTVSIFAPGATTATATLTGLDSPNDLVLDSSGNLFVADRLSLTEFSPSLTPVATFTGLSNPSAPAFDSKGNLYVANGDAVKVYPPAGTTSSATLQGGLTHPGRPAIDANDNVYVASRWGTTVNIFRPGNTTSSASLTGLGGPGALTFDSAGNLFVVNTDGTNTVSEFAKSALDSAVTWTASFTSKHVGNGIPIVVSQLTLRGAQSSDYSLLLPTTTGNITPAPLTVAGVTANDKVYDGTVNALVDTQAAKLAGVASGDTVTLSTTPSTYLTGLNGAGGMAVDASDDLYVVNTYANTVSKFASGSTTPSTTLTGMIGPGGLVFDLLC
jgi:sugar lactone lactonase YvrE